VTFIPDDPAVIVKTFVNWGILMNPYPVAVMRTADKLETHVLVKIRDGYGYIVTIAVRH
jgi:hypothetical protein